MPFVYSPSSIVEAGAEASEWGKTGEDGKTFSEKRGFSAGFSKNFGDMGGDVHADETPETTFLLCKPHNYSAM